ncbi:MAG: N-acetylglucosamine-6-phosphate deacetylase [Actinomycetota bacterium]|nr:N-acetylglucosamine-6-phosphate deacetylase [Actinomycetota bacterium]
MDQGAPQLTSDTARGTTLVLRGGRTVSGAALSDLVMVDGHILPASPQRSGAPPVDLASPPPGTDAIVIDTSGLTIVPGFIDLQINGGFGRDFTANPQSVWEVGSRLPAWGVTAFLPTLVSTDPGTIDAATGTVVAGPPPGYAGATVLGLHLEGPFLAPSRRGAHDEAMLRPPSPDLVSGWSPSTGVRMVTLAPELPGALDTITMLVGNGVVVSAGHSDAAFEEAMAGFAAGATMVTHLFNAMSGIGHRSPGLAAAALAHPTVVSGLIADGHHVHAGAVRVARAALGPNRIALVSDAVAAAGAGGGGDPVRLGPMEISADGSVPRTAAGVLAGSLLSLDRAVRCYMELTGVDAAEAVAAVTTVPAAAMRLTDHGRLGGGFRGDATILDDDLAVVATIVGGRVVHGGDRLLGGGQALPPAPSQGDLGGG